MAVDKGSSQDRLDEWRDALSLWGYGIDLVEPEPLKTSEELAFINLRDRQTWVNYDLASRVGLMPEMRTVFAHEIGHHIRYPHTLVRSMKLLQRQREFLDECLIKKLAPKERKSTKSVHLDYLLNLFTDLLINDDLWLEHKLDFTRIYQALSRSGPPSAVFSFYMAVYEALWGLSSGSLVTQAMSNALQKADPNGPDRARSLATRIRPETNLFVQQRIFLEGFWPFVASDVKDMPNARPVLLEDLLAEGVKELTPSEIIETSMPSEEEREADDWIDQKREEGRVVPGPGRAPKPRKESDDPGQRLGRCISLAQGLGRAKQVPALILLFYERLAQKYLLEPERVQNREPVSPTTLTIWDVGDDMARIDWTTSLIRSGTVVPGYTAVERDWEDEPRSHGQKEAPWLEIYIDSSGSMPNPAEAFSHLAFAGFLLAKTALEAESKVRIIQYSGHKEIKAMKGFTASPAKAYQALLEYFGDGTDFPFPTLEDSLNRHRGDNPIARVIITDSDFLSNVQRSGYSVSALPLLTRACEESASVTAILNLGGMGEFPWPAGLVETGIRLVPIANWEELAGVAVEVSDGLFPK